MATRAPPIAAARSDPSNLEVAGDWNPDEVGRLEAELREGVAEGDRIAIRPLLRAQPALGSGVDDLRGMLIGAREEEDVVACEALRARDRIGDRGREDVPDVRLIVDVVDRCREIESRGLGHFGGM
jgi:hypothetical protein